MEVIRKQIEKLLITDLEQCPFWEFALDEEGKEGQDETTVRPNPSWTLGRGLCAVRTDFKLNCGIKQVGYLIHNGAIKNEKSYNPKNDDEKIKYYNPTVVLETEQVVFWYGLTKPAIESIKKYYSLFSKTADEIFPLEYEAVLPDNEFVLGKIIGFGYIERKKKSFLSKSVETYAYMK